MSETAQGSRLIAYAERIIAEGRNRVTAVTGGKSANESNNLPSYKAKPPALLVTKPAGSPGVEAAPTKNQIEQSVKPPGYEVTALQADSSEVSCNPAAGPYASGWASLNARCPRGIDTSPWRQAIEDAQRFLAAWGTEAELLGWSAEDLFGLHPAAPACRYDAMGLIWLIAGGDVVALTSEHASIRRPKGAGLRFYRQRAA